MADSMSITVDARSAIAGLDRYLEYMTGEVRRLVERGTEMLYTEAKELASLADHSLEDLRALGNPYAMRWGANMLHPDYLIHIQSGTLLANLRREVKDEGENISGYVHSEAWYSAFLEFGTVKMRPRFWMHQVLENLRGQLLSAAQHVGAGSGTEGAVGVTLGVEAGKEPVSET